MNISEESEESVIGTYWGPVDSVKANVYLIYVFVAGLVAIGFGIGLIHDSTVKPVELKKELEIPAVSKSIVLDGGQL